MVLADTFAQEPPAKDRRFNGKIIHVNDEGWGFITTPEVRFVRIFFHWTGLKNDTKKFLELKKGMKVEFNIKEYPDKGFRAIKIEVKDEKVES